MPHWTIELPHARRYIANSWFDGAEDDLNPPQTFKHLAYMPQETSSQPTRAISISVPYTLSTWIHASHGCIHSHYYEISFNTENPPRIYTSSLAAPIIHAGYTFAWPKGYTTYGSDGWIRSNGQLILQIEWYHPGDVIGCGYDSEFPSSLFFTKNGKCIKRISTENIKAIPAVPAIHIYRPHRITNSGFRDIHVNWGQQPFTFDIANHFAASYNRSRNLANRIPWEILENILQLSLLSIDLDPRTKDSTKYNLIKRLSGICTRSLTLVSRFKFETMNISSREDLESALTICRGGAYLHVQEVVTLETPDSAFIHQFFVSPFLSRVVSTTTTLSGASLRGSQFLERIPPSISQRLYCLIRHPFRSLHVLKLSRYSFPTWVRFAQFIFTFRALQTLECQDVTWPSAPAQPPSWLAFSCRLRSASCTDSHPFKLMDDPGLLHLFISGHPRNRNSAAELTLGVQDVLHVTRLTAIFRELAGWQLCCRPQYELTQAGLHCTLTCFLENRAPTTMNLEFQQTGQAFQLVLINISTTYWPEDAHLKQLIEVWEALSSADICRCRMSIWGSNPYDPLTGQRSPLPHHRRWSKILAATKRQYFAGLFELVFDGKIITYGDIVKASLVVEKVEEVNGSLGKGRRLKWDMIALKPLLDGPTFSRLRLYESDSNTFQAEIGRDIDVLRGHHEFSTSELAYGSYFLVVETGRQSWRTRDFRVRKETESSHQHAQLRYHWQLLDLSSKDGWGSDMDGSSGSGWQSNTENVLGDDFDMRGGQFDTYWGGVDASRPPSQSRLHQDTDWVDDDGNDPLYYHPDHLDHGQQSYSHFPPILYSL